MNIDKTLDTINSKYYDADGENKAEIVDEIKQIHVSLLKKPEELKSFMEKALLVCGGAYIPYLYWIALSNRLSGKENLVSMLDILQAFSNSDFEEDDQVLIKPLIVIYLNTENDFEINKIKSTVFDKAHPTVSEYFQDLQDFGNKNIQATKTYLHKFDLLRPYFPNFELFGLPIAHLEEQLKSMS